MGSPPPSMVLSDSPPILQALLRFLREECDERGATVIYSTHIFDGLDDWPTHVLHLKDGAVTIPHQTANAPQITHHHHVAPHNITISLQPTPNHFTPSHTHPSVHTHTRLTHIAQVEYCGTFEGAPAVAPSYVDSSSSGSLYQRVRGWLLAERDANKERKLADPMDVSAVTPSPALPPAALPADAPASSRGNRFDRFGGGSRQGMYR